MTDRRSATSRGRRVRGVLGRLAAVLGLVVLAGVADVASAPRSLAAACTSSSGVTVVVDYGSLGGTAVGCATSFGTGIAALQSAGHSIAYLPRQQGMVCTIDRRPDPCNGAPTTAYWSYWRASPGGSWSYSTVGASGTHPKPGTVEGWAFGAGKPPSTRPPSASGAKPSPTSTRSSTTTRSTPGHSASRTTPAAAGGSTPASRPTAAATAAGTAKATATSTPSSSSSPASSTDGSTTQVLTATRTDAAVPTSATTDSSDSTGIVVTAALVLLLAAGGGVIVWRRRGSGG